MALAKTRAGGMDPQPTTRTHTMNKLIQSLLCGAALISTLALAGPAAAAPELSGQININTATEGQLDLLPGIGPSIAKKVLAYRASKDFGDITHLMRIKGIGRKTFNKLKPYLAVDGATTLQAVGSAPAGKDKAKNSKNPSNADNADNVDNADNG